MKLIVLLVLLATILAAPFFVQIYQIPNNYMEPTFKSNQYLIFKKNPFKGFNPQRGDIVLYHNPESKKDIVGRVIALPSEKITISKGNIYIDKKGVFQLNEPYLDPKIRNEIEAEEMWFGLGNTEYLILSDYQRSKINLQENIVEQRDIIGRLWLALPYPRSPKRAKLD